MSFVVIADTLINNTFVKFLIQVTYTPGEVLFLKGPNKSSLQVSKL